MLTRYSKKIFRSLRDTGYKFSASDYNLFSKASSKFIGAFTFSDVDNVFSCTVENKYT